MGPALSHLVHEEWTQDQGLPQNTVFAIARSREGYLWVATFEGLARFDGVRFVAQPLVTSDGAPWGDPEALLADREGALWIATARGVLRLRDGVLAGYRFATTVPARVRFTNLRLLEDADGSVWVTTSQGPPLHISPDGASALHAAPDSRVDGVTAMTKTPDGALLFAGHKGMWRVTEAAASLEAVPEPCAGAVDHLTWGSHGLVVALREGGLCLGASPTSLQRLDTPYGAVPFNAPVDDGKALWLPSTVGLARYADGAFETFRPGEHIRCVLYDDEESLWVGSAVGGLLRLRPSAVTTYAPPEGATSVYTLSPAPDGSMYFGTERAGICRVRGDRVETAVPRDANEFARQGMATMGDALAVATLDELVIYRPGIPERRFKLGLGSTGLHTSLFRDSQGTLWATSNGPGKIARFDGSSVTTIDPPAPRSILTMAEYPAGTLWFAGPDGLLRWTAGVFASAPAPPGARVTRLIFDERGVGWLTSDHGLWRMDEGRFVHFGVAEGLPTDSLHGVLDDGRGRLWCHSNTGLFSVPRVELDEIARGARARANVTTYDRLDGLLSREFNGGTSTSTRDAAGRLWFANLRGAVLVEPDRAPRSARPPPVLVESFTVDGRQVPLEHAVVPPGGKQFAIEYTGLHLLVPSRLRFRYRLEGVEDDWVDAGTRRTAYYTSLPPGRHRFRVEASEEPGVWSEAGGTLELEVEPFLYQTRFFRALLVIAAALLVSGLTWGGSRLRIRQLEAQRRKLEDTVTERTRELAQSKELGDRLLRNILPEVIAERLQQSTDAIAENYPEATVLFADIVGFTDLSASISPEELVELLNDLFTRFDGLLEQGHIEKIKTIGDAYMAVAGVPEPRAEHARAMVEMAFGMLREMESFNSARGLKLKMRIGIHTGPVVAGVIGKRKFSYDLWGDTVNTASRMESHGVPGKVHVSDATWQRVVEHFEGEDRGLIQVKGKGEVHTHFVLRPQA